MVAPGTTFKAPVGQNLVRVDPNIHNEMFHQWNVIVQWEFRPNWLAETGYVASRGRNLLVIQNIGNSGSGFPGSRLVTTHGTVQNISYTGSTMASSRNSNGALLRGCQFLLPMSGREPPTIRQVVSALEARDQALAVFRIRFVQNLIGPDQTLTRPTVSPSQVCGIYLSAKAAAMQAILRAASNC